jgi:hypothetical protein
VGKINKKFCPSELGVRGRAKDLALQRINVVKSMKPGFNMAEWCMQIYGSYRAILQRIVT